MTGSFTVDIENEESLRKYLLSKRLIRDNDTIVFTVLRGGVSNKTVRVTFAGHSYVLKQGLQKLRVPGDWFSNPARIEREAAGMVALKKILPDNQITRLIFVDKPACVLMMEAVPEPHENFKTLLLKGGDQSALIQRMALMLATIHRTTWHNHEFENEFGNQEFFYELRIDPYFRFCAQQFPESAPWFQKNIFDNLGIENCLVHGDFSPKNMLVYQNELVLLDHEVIHYGDFAFDFGFVFAHLFLKSVHLSSTQFLADSLAFADTYFGKMDGLISETDRERAVHNFLACLFARVAGKSKTDYLGNVLEERIKIALVGIFQKGEVASMDTVNILYEKVQKG